MDMLELRQPRRTRRTWLPMVAQPVRPGSATAILRWERAHHTMVGGKGTDMHGWRNALNYFGWGSSACSAGIARLRRLLVHVVRLGDEGRGAGDDRRPASPSAMAAWAGRHAVMITGYYDLKGDPFARDGAGQYTDAFSVGGFYLSDPSKSAGRRNARISYAPVAVQLGCEAALPTLSRDRQPATTTSTPPAGVTSKSEWYGKCVADRCRCADPNGRGCARTL